MCVPACFCALPGGALTPTDSRADSAYLPKEQGAKEVGNCLSHTVESLGMVVSSGQVVMLHEDNAEQEKCSELSTSGMVTGLQKAAPRGRVRLPIAHQYPH